MKRLLLALAIVIPAMSSFASQVVLRAGQHPSTQFLTNFGTGNPAIFTVTGSPQGSTDEGIRLTYTFLKPMVAVEFGFSTLNFSVVGAGIQSVDGAGDYNDQFVNDNVTSYWWAGAEDGNLKSFSFYSSKNAFNLDSANDFLNVLAVRGTVRNANYVPEPSSFALFAIAMLGLTTVGLRKRLK
jgi:hypothetical protein